MTLNEALEWADKFGLSLTPTTSTVTAITLAAEVRRLQSETCKDCSLWRMTEQIQALQSEVTALRLYAPAQRAQPTVKTAPIAPPNLAFFGIVETDEELAERAGTKVTEVVR